MFILHMYSWYTCKLKHFKNMFILLVQFYSALCLTRGKNYILLTHSSGNHLHHHHKHYNTCHDHRIHTLRLPLFETFTFCYIFILWFGVQGYDPVTPESNRRYHHFGMRDAERPWHAHHLSIDLATRAAPVIYGLFKPIMKRQTISDTDGFPNHLLRLRFCNASRNGIKNCKSL